MDIANMDMRIRAVREELARKQMEMVNKYKVLKEKIQNNELLVEVLDDYRDYCDTLISNKHRQADTLSNLTQHLDKINQDLENTDSIVKSTNEDHRQIMKEIQNIKRDLDNYGLDN